MLVDKDLSVMFRVALGIISLKEHAIVQCTSTNELVQLVMSPFLQDESGDEVKVSQLMDLIHHNVKRVPLQDLQERRDEAYIQQRKEFEEYQTKKELVLLSRTTHCKRILLRLLPLLLTFSAS